MYKEELSLAKKAVTEAGIYLKSHYEPKVESAIDKDIKLSSDKESEQIILDILEPTGIPVLSEERGLTGTKKDGMMWVVDPLDGSANYWKGMTDLSCVSVALWDGEKPLLGVINRFFANELYEGVVQEGALLNGKEIQTSGVTSLREAFLATGFPVKRDYSAEAIERLIKQAQSFKKVRMFGAAAVMGAFVANGKADAYTEENIMFWDIAASTAIVAAAGGKTKVRFLSPDQCVCELFATDALYEAYCKETEGVNAAV